MNIATQKDNIIKWIQTIEDAAILNRLESIKSEENFDFEKHWQRSTSIKDARKNSQDFIKALPWKK